MDNKTLFVLLITGMIISGCAAKETLSIMAKKTEKVEKQNFGKNLEGKDVTLYALTNSHGLRARVMDYGAILVSLEVPDQGGKLADVTLGFDNLEPYLSKHPFFGAIAGRYANRIGRATFTLDGVEYKLDANNGPNHLHGGLKGFDKVMWSAEILADSSDPAVKFTYLSKDMDQGYPGNLNCSVTYALTDNDELKISYQAVTDKPTIINLTNHTYWNLAGAGNVLGHELTINADRYTVVDDGLIPTGEIKSAQSTPLDFTQPKTIGSHIDQLPQTKGYDHNYVLNKNNQELSLAARTCDPVSGRVMETYTTEPGMQLYTGNYLDGIKGKSGKSYNQHAGFCLETQHYPDSPNKPDFPSTVLRPGETYNSVTIYKFSTR